GSAITPGYRTGPDVSFDADPNTGVFIFDTEDGGPDAVGGTSYATPVWAAMVAMVNKSRALKGLPTLDGVSQTLPLIYDLSSNDFHDITSGNNGTYTAGPGYDEVTGLGTPVVNQVIADMAQPFTVAPDGHTLYLLNANGNLDRYNASGWQTIKTGVKSFKL